MKRFTLLISMLFIGWVHAQEFIQQVGNTGINENRPVLANRSNGHILMAAQTYNSISSNNDLLLTEYDENGILVRSIIFEEMVSDECPIDMLEEADGRILILGQRRGNVQINGSPNRQHGFIMRVQNFGTNSFSKVTDEDISPPFGTVANDFSVTPQKMIIAANGNIKVAGNIVDLTNGGVISNTFRNFLIELDINTLLLGTLAQQHWHVSNPPNQLGSLLQLPDGRFLMSGYATVVSLSNCVHIVDNTGAVNATNITLIDAGGMRLNYNNFYKSALWNGQLILVGDWIPTGLAGGLHRLSMGRATINANGTVNVQNIFSFYDANSSSANAGDGNNFNDFNDFRVADIKIRGNELIVLGIFRDVNETLNPTFSEFCILSIDLQTNNVNYCRIFNNMANLNQNFAQKLIINSGNELVVAGETVVAGDDQIILGKAIDQTKLGCRTDINIIRENINWVNDNINIVNRNYSFTSTPLNFTDANANLQRDVVCTEEAAACEDVRDYLFYPNNSTIFTNTVWGTQKPGSKYYINGTLTVQDVTLDITNCDVVFGPCGRIVFNGSNALLRANNSVFRTCNDSDKWDGLIFNGGVHHKIIECEFKNAMNAIQVMGNSADITQIVRNTFINNYIGIDLNSVEFDGSITGNHFEVNRPILNFNQYECTPFPGAPFVQFYGIRGNQTILWSPLSQNEFVAEDMLTSTTAKTWEYIGVGLTNSSGIIATNRFVNNTRAVSMNGISTLPTFVNKIESNEIFLNRTVENAIAQISVVNANSGSSNLLVTNNTLVNNRRLAETLINYSAIYLESCTDAIVERNKITGFDIGINLNGGTNVETSLNEINGSYRIGINVGYMEGYMVNCNRIDMQYSNSTINCVGIRIAYSNTMSGSGILPALLHSNCVFNTETAIEFAGGGMFGSALPSIRNNYLYNYLNNGILVGTSVTGTIGTAAQLGMNTFASHSNAIDINNLNVPNVSATGNFFELAVITGGNVTISTPNKYSVASCGQQLMTGPNANRSTAISGTTGVVFKCDARGALVMNPNAGEGGGNEMVLKPIVNGAEYTQDIFHGNIAANVYGKYKVAAFITLLNESRKNKKISDFMYFNYLSRYYQSAENYPFALQYLDSVPCFTEIERESVQIDKYRVMMMSGLKGQEEVNIIKDFLQQVIASNNMNYNKAYYLQAMLNGPTDLKLPAIEVVDHTIKHQVKVMNNDIQLSVFPNPAVEKLQVSIVGQEQTAEGKCTIEILDMNGRKFYQGVSDLIAGIVDLDISELQSSIYLIKVQFEDGSFKTSTFIKL